MSGYSGVASRRQDYQVSRGGVNIRQGAGCDVIRARKCDSDAIESGRPSESANKVD